MINAVARRALGLVTAGLLVAACSTTTDGTPQDGSGPGSGSGSSASSGPALGKVWSNKIDGQAGSDQQLASVTSDGRNVYASDVSGHVWELSGADGKVVWESHPGARSGDGPTYVAGRLFFNDTDKGLYALNPKTGKTVWHVARGWIAGGSNILVPASRGVVVLPDDSGGFVGVRATTGKKVWSRPTPAYADYGAADSSNVYLSYTTGDTDPTGVSVRAIDPLTGATRWQRNRSLPAHADQQVYATGGLVILLVKTSKGETAADTMTAFDPKTGTTRWSTTADAILGISPPTTARGVVAFPSLKGVEGFSVSTGKPVYTVAMDHGPSGAVANCGALVCSYGINTIAALDASGKIVTSTRTSGDDALGLAPTRSGPLIIYGAGTVARYSR